MSTKRQQEMQWGILLLLMLALVVYAVYTQLLSAGSFFNKNDPEFVYLLNSMGFLSGEAYEYVDHPGTPVNLTGSLILLPLKLFARWRGYDFATYILLYPQRFLVLARLFISLLHVIAAFAIWRFSKDRVSFAGLVLILMSYFVAYGAGIWWITVFWSHNAVAFSLGTLFLFVTFRTLTDAREHISYAKWAWLGVGTGFLTSIQLYYLAWLVGLLATMFFLLLIEKQTRRAFINAGGAIVIGFVVGFMQVNLPILHRFGYMFHWFGSMIGSLGIYDRGEPGIFSIPVLWENFLWFQRHGFALLFVIVVVLLVGFMLLAFQRRDFAANKVSWAMVGGLSIQLLVAFLLVLKQPRDIYLVSVAALLPILLFIWFGLHRPDNNYWQVFYTVLAIGCLLLFAQQYATAFQRHALEKNTAERHIASVEICLTEYATQQPDKTRDELQIFVQYGYTPTISLCKPWRLADIYSTHHYTNLINQICSNERQWNAWSNVFDAEQAASTLDEYAGNWDALILDALNDESTAFFEDRGLTIQHLESGIVCITP